MTVPLFPPDESGTLYPGLSDGENQLRWGFRWGFIRKVYGILAAQMILTTASSVTVLYSPVNDLLRRNSLVEKDPEKAIPLFWAAINAGDRVDSALKDMAIVMKQHNRVEEAIEAIKSLRSRCSEQSQESLDNILLDLYKRCGRLIDQIGLLRHKLFLIHQGMAFNGKRTKTT